MTRTEKIAFLEANGWANKFNGIWWTREGSGNVRMEKALEMTTSTPMFDPTSTVQEIRDRASDLLTGLGERSPELWIGPSKPKKPWETSEYWERLGA